MQPFTQQAVMIIKNVPEGKVMTYGQIARLAGNPRAARQVVRILHSMSKKYRLPWHRVINTKGQISIKEDSSYQDQVLSLQSEGVKVIETGIVSLGEYLWHPEDKSIST